MLHAQRSESGSVNATNVQRSKPTTGNGSEAEAQESLVFCQIRASLVVGNPTAVPFRLLQACIISVEYVTYCQFWRGATTDSEHSNSVLILTSNSRQVADHQHHL